MKMNFTIVILYSPDRQEQLIKSIECWSDCIGYAEAEKILCLDGQGWTPSEFKICNIERTNDFFCWAASLNTGVSAASNEMVLYMDCDRIIPTNFLLQAESMLRENPKSFVYLKNLFNLKRDENVENIKMIRDNVEKFRDVLKPDHRQNNPEIFSRKNAMSGCVAFCKSHFMNLGGFDERFVGWGYPDYDFLMKALKSNSELISINASELHQKHQYTADHREFTLHNLYNMNQYVCKWDLNNHIIKQTCKSCDVDFKELRSSTSLQKFLFKVMSREGKII